MNNEEKILNFLEKMYIEIVSHLLAPNAHLDQ